MNTKKILSLLLLTAAFTACSNEDGISLVEPAPLVVTVNNNYKASRAFVGGETLPVQSTIGIQLVDEGGVSYSGIKYANVPYYSENGLNWSVPEGTTVPILYNTTGKSVAYYPYSPEVTDITKIPVTTAEQNDYMYSDVMEVNAKNNEVAYNMNHALAGIRLNVIKTQNHPDVTVEKITVLSDGFAISATLNAMTGELYDVVGLNKVLTHTETFSVTTTGKEIGFVAIPAATATSITFRIDAGDTDYATTVTLDEPFKQGYIYDYTLAFNAEQLVPSQVSVGAWNKGNGEEGKEVGMQIDPWSVISNGVYAVSADGSPVEVANANSECVAVALIVNDAPTPQRLMIEKNGEANTTSIQAAYTADGASNTGYTYFYWGMYNSDISGITNWADGDGVTIPTDYTTWSTNSTYAWNDFNGKANTAAIQATSDTDSHTTYANMGTWCTKFNQTASENQGYTDWYIPACGQLALIHLNMTDINTALTKIGGTTLAYNDYWSSSEYNSGNGWEVSFRYDNLNGMNKGGSNLVRFVRDI